MIEVEITASGAPQNAEETICRAAKAALEHERRDGDIGVLLTDDKTIHQMNRDFRHVDRPTDVLSFPSSEGEQLMLPPSAYLGDIAISLETAERQAEEYGHSLARELSFLTVHGTLHILGYDHVDEAGREAMFALQTLILEEIGETR